ncbi:MAG TPA: hypothetical protein VJ020_05120, partial [Anaerolineales bacterium]|nr:hypothetical protein [Anaerolineales bacterium]
MAHLTQRRQIPPFAIALVAVQMMHRQYSLFTVLLVPAVLIAIYAIIRLMLLNLFAGNPGAVMEWHLWENVRVWILNTRVTMPLLFIAAWVVWQIRRHPQPR